MFQQQPAGLCAIHTPPNFLHMLTCDNSLVCRLRDAEAAAAKAAAELSQQQAARMRGIAAVLDSEEKEYQKQLARQEIDRQVG